MYTIVMRDDKSLRVTKKTTLYQREKLVDKIEILIPQQYEEMDLSEFTAILKYLDQGNVAHAEILTIDKELYNGYLRCVFPVDTKLNQFAGDITIRITLTKTDLESKTQYVLHTGETVITILPLEDYYAFISDGLLEYIDQVVGNIDAKIEAINKISVIYDETKADNIVKNNDGEIQLTSNGLPIGDSIAVDEAELEVVEF